MRTACVQTAAATANTRGQCRSQRHKLWLIRRNSRSNLRLSGVVRLCGGACHDCSSHTRLGLRFGAAGRNGCVPTPSGATTFATRSPPVRLCWPDSGRCRAHGRCASGAPDTPQCTRPAHSARAHSGMRRVYNPCAVPLRFCADEARQAGRTSVPDGPYPCSTSVVAPPPPPPAPAPAPPDWARAAPALIY